MITFVSPTLEYAILAPILIVLAGALIGVLIEAFAPRSARASSQLFITLTALVLSLASVIRLRNTSSTTAAME
jgi:NADH-quinone oxidoreductase subunit N